jgi:hypothetical protein
MRYRSWWTRIRALSLRRRSLELKEPDSSPRHQRRAEGRRSLFSSLLSVPL